MSRELKVGDKVRYSKCATLAATMPDREVIAIVGNRLWIRSPVNEDIVVYADNYSRVTTKKEGWINIYRKGTNPGNNLAISPCDPGNNVFSTEDAARTQAAIYVKARKNVGHANAEHLDTVKISWEE